MGGAAEGYGNDNDILCKLHFAATTGKFVSSRFVVDFLYSHSAVSHTVVYKSEPLKQYLWNIR